MSKERIFGVGVVNQEVPVFPGCLVRDIMDGQRFFALAFLTRCFGIEDLSVIDFLMPHEDVGKLHFAALSSRAKTEAQCRGEKPQLNLLLETRISSVPSRS